MVWIALAIILIKSGGRSRRDHVRKTVFQRNFYDLPRPWLSRYSKLSNNQRVGGSNPASSSLSLCLWSNTYKHPTFLRMGSAASWMAEAPLGVWVNGWMRGLGKVHWGAVKVLENSRISAAHFPTVWIRLKNCSKKSSVIFERFVCWFFFKFRCFHSQFLSQYLGLL